MAGQSVDLKVYPRWRIWVRFPEWDSRFGKRKTSSHMITLEKTIRTEVDPMEYEIKQSARKAKVKITEDPPAITTTLCEINTETGKISDLSILEGVKMTPMEMCERLRVVDSALKDLGFQGIIEDSDLEDRVAQLEKRVE